MLSDHEVVDPSLVLLPFTAVSLLVLPSSRLCSGKADESSGTVDSAPLYSETSELLAFPTSVSIPTVVVAVPPKSGSPVEPRSAPACPTSVLMKIPSGSVCPSLLVAVSFPNRLSRAESTVLTGVGVIWPSSDLDPSLDRTPPRSNLLPSAPTAAKIESI